MTDKRLSNDAAMAEILASIRRIVADENRSVATFDAEGDVLILTREMRIDDNDGEAARSAGVIAPAVGVSIARGQPEAALSVDEATVVEIARIVLRDEFDGEFGRSLTAQITRLVREEVARALVEQRRARD